MIAHAYARSVIRGEPARTVAGPTGAFVGGTLVGEGSGS